jgi:hypothetical protein
MLEARSVASMRNRKFIESQGVFDDIEDSGTDRLAVVISLGRSMTEEITYVVQQFNAVVRGESESVCFSGLRGSQTTVDRNSGIGDEFGRFADTITTEDADLLVLKSIAPLCLSVLSHIAHALHRVQEHGVEGGDERMWEFQRDLQDEFGKLIDALAQFYGVRIQLGSNDEANFGLLATDRQVGSEQIQMLVSFATKAMHNELRDVLFTNSVGMDTLANLRKYLRKWQGVGSFVKSPTKSKRFERSAAKSRKNIAQATSRVGSAISRSGRRQASSEKHAGKASFLDHHPGTARRPSGKWPHLHAAGRVVFVVHKCLR